ncbi:hypothetical protein, partial [Alteromonas sp.]|uniref:hypothetical protein n=1 Tax=Alteromonas sp. TaxID=232 RepID=UPI003EEA2123
NHRQTGAPAGDHRCTWHIIPRDLFLNLMRNVGFTLYLTPVLYLALARFTKPRADESAKLEKEMEEANAQHS